MAWLYVPGLAALKSDCPLPLEDSIKLYVVLSGKHLLRPLSWRGWKRRSYIKRLFGTILQPSTAIRGVEQLIFSLRESRASHTAPLENEKGTKTRVRSGRNSSESWKKCAPPWSSSKMCQNLLPMDTFDLSDALYRDWVTKSKTRSSSLRQTLAQATGGNVCGFWPTPNPAGGGNPPELLRKKGGHYIRRSGKKAFLHLDQAAQMWATPTARDTKGRDQPKRQGGASLPHQLLKWPTPTVHGDYNRKGASKTSGDGLATAAKNWPTPQASDDRNTSGGRGPDKNPNPRLAAFRFSRQAEEKGICLTGFQSSKDGPKLNPLFDEWLMGWPLGWTGSGPVGKEWSRWWRLWRSWLSARGLV